MYTLDLGGTQLRLYHDESLIYQCRFNGNINTNVQFIQQLVMIIQDLEINEHVTIGIAGYLTCSSPLKAELESALAKQLTNFTVMSDAELHSKNLITKDQLLVALGTGSVASYYQNGQFTVLGGYGHIFGDLGSGYHFGKQVIISYLNNYEANCHYEYMDKLERYFKAKGRNILTLSLNNEKSFCSMLAKQFMDDPAFELVFNQYFAAFEKELTRWLLISQVKEVVITGAITNSKRFRAKLDTLDINIIIK